MFLFIILFIILPLAVLIWSRFIEPQIILIHHQTIKVGFKIRIALIADLHLGAYKNEKFLARTVKKINSQNPDLILIAGDFIYADKKIPQFSALAHLQAPVYAVWGNHDYLNQNSTISQPKTNQCLKTILKANKVKILENQTAQFKNFTLLGLNDHWSKNDDTNLLNNYSQKDHLIVLTHNPDTIALYPNDSADLTLCGHTHAGQIRLPFLYKKVIPTKGKFDRGLSRQKNTQLFITGGLGEIVLPLRLFNPPTIDILELE